MNRTVGSFQKLYSPRPRMLRKARAVDEFPNEFEKSV